LNIILLHQGPEQPPEQLPDDGGVEESIMSLEDELGEENNSSSSSYNVAGNEEGAEASLSFVVLQEEDVRLGEGIKDGAEFSLSFLVLYKEVMRPGKRILQEG
jgi:hypothetical protein